MSKIHFYSLGFGRTEINKTVESESFEDTAQFREYLKTTAKGQELEGAADDFDVDLWDRNIIEILNHENPAMLIAHNSHGYDHSPEQIQDYFIADSEKSFEEFLTENLPEISTDTPKKTRLFYEMYFDFEKYKQDSLINTYFESKGYYFLRH